MTRYLRVRLDADLEAKLDRATRATGRTPSELIRHAIASLPIVAIVTGEADPTTERVRWQDCLGRIAAHGNRSPGWEIVSLSASSAGCLNAMGFQHDGMIEVVA